MSTLIDVTNLCLKLHTYNDVIGLDKLIPCMHTKLTFNSAVRCSSAVVMSWFDFKQLLMPAVEKSAALRDTPRPKLQATGGGGCQRIQDRSFNALLCWRRRCFFLRDAWINFCSLRKKSQICQNSTDVISRRHSRLSLLFFALDFWLVQNKARIISTKVEQFARFFVTAALERGRVPSLHYSICLRLLCCLLFVTSPKH